MPTHTISYLQFDQFQPVLRTISPLFSGYPQFFNIPKLPSCGIHMEIVPIAGSVDRSPNRFDSIPLGIEKIMVRWTVIRTCSIVIPRTVKGVSGISVGFDTKLPNGFGPQWSESVCYWTETEVSGQKTYLTKISPKIV